jgi:hypothetical protein
VLTRRSYSTSLNTQKASNSFPAAVEMAIVAFSFTSRLAFLRPVSDGDLVSMFNSGHHEMDLLEEEFRALLEGEGFSYELQTPTSALIIPEDEAFQADLLKVYRWQWIQKLSERRLYSLHREVFEFFARDPDRLKQLGWRQFEEFLDAIFKNQGFHTQIGPGRGDRGIDHRLYQSEGSPRLSRSFRPNDTPANLLGSMRLRLSLASRR